MDSKAQQIRFLNQNLIIHYMSRVSTAETRVTFQEGKEEANGRSFHILGAP